MKNLSFSDFESFLKEGSSGKGKSQKENLINGGGNASIDLKTNNAKIFIKKK